MKNKLSHHWFPTIYVIYGVTGDLAKKKLIPSLYRLYSNGVLPKKFSVIGVSRRDWSDEFFREEVKKILFPRGIKNGHNGFLGMFHFQKGLFDNLESYNALRDHLLRIDEQWGLCTNKLIHLSVPPEFYSTIFDNLKLSGLAAMCGPKDGWTRILVEKPFGKDFKTAQELEIKLSSIFKEDQIFRVDHYLGKETIQSILSFRFSNTIFEPIWSNKFIKKIEIRVLEDFDVKDRGDSYDGIGALRDMGQNHLLQMLALTIMDHPGTGDAQFIRRERAKVLEKLKTISKVQLKKTVIRGQYKGYKETEGVKRNSQTETYYKIQAFVDIPRWKGVPIIMESGKALYKKRAEITIYFKAVEPCFCPPNENHVKHSNTLTFIIQPDEGISIKFWAKKPGFLREVEPRNLFFKYQGGKSKLGSYEKLIFDAISGDQTLFPTTEEVLASWKFITPIIKNWQTLPLYEYEKGSKGPVVNL